MMHGRNNGKKLMAMRIVKHAFEIIHLLTGEVNMTVNDVFTLLCCLVIIKGIYRAQDRPGATNALVVPFYGRPM